MKRLAKSPELFEKKRQRLLNEFIASARSKEEQAQLRIIQNELDSSRSQGNFQLKLANELLQQVVLKQTLLEKGMSAYLKAGR